MVLVMYNQTVGLVLGTTVINNNLLRGSTKQQPFKGKHGFMHVIKEENTLIRGGVVDCRQGGSVGLPRSSSKMKGGAR